MNVPQLKESQHYRKSFLTALRALFGQKTKGITLPKGVRFADMALFFPLLGLVVGFITMVTGMLSVFFFRSNFIGAACSLFVAFLLMRTFYSGKQTLRITPIDAVTIVLWASLLYTSYERSRFLPVMASFGFAFISVYFACGLGKDADTDCGATLCGGYRNEDLFFMILQVVMVAVVSLLSLKVLWYWGFVPSLFVAAAVPHFVSKVHRGVTLEGIKRGIILTAVLTMAIFLLV